jgi:hypothetical protein
MKVYVVSEAFADKDDLKKNSFFFLPNNHLLRNTLIEPSVESSGLN